MKRLVLAIICTIIIFIFLALNFLLWDREQSVKSIESLKYSNEEKEASIAELDKLISAVNDALTVLNGKLRALDTNNKVLEEKIEKMSKQERKYKQLLEQKDDVIFRFKQQADLKPLEETIRLWVNYVNKRQYEAAYKLMIKDPDFDGEGLTLEGFTDIYGSSIKSININSMKFTAGNATDSRKGEITFKVILNVEKLQSETKTPFTDGINERFFAVSFNRARNSWAISSIYKAG